VNSEVLRPRLDLYKMNWGGGGIDGELEELNKLKPTTPRVHIFTITE